jgi:hypothetical protein
VRAIVLDVILQVQQCNVILQCFWLILRVENDPLDANNLEGLWLGIAAQSPLSGLNEDIIVTVTVST